MDAETKNILVKCFRALVLFLDSHPHAKKYLWLLLAVGLAVALAYGVSSCSSKHYFSINADEITNPSILYSDSTGVSKSW